MESEGTWSAPEEQIGLADQGSCPPPQYKGAEMCLRPSTEICLTADQAMILRQKSRETNCAHGGDSVTQMMGQCGHQPATSLEPLRAEVFIVKVLCNFLKILHVSTETKNIPDHHWQRKKAGIEDQEQHQNAAPTSAPDSVPSARTT